MNDEVSQTGLKLTVLRPDPQAVLVELLRQFKVLGGHEGLDFDNAQIGHVLPLWCLRGDGLSS